LEGLPVVVPKQNGKVSILSPLLFNFALENTVKNKQGKGKI
jgi:hypothetical protein